jgi:capsular polysaccharide transport system permease protein
MTTKPKARKFRIRKSGGASTTGPDADGSATEAATSDTRMGDASGHRHAADKMGATFAATEDGFSDTPFPGSAAYDRMQAEAAGEPQEDPQAGSGRRGTAVTARMGGAPTAEQELAAIRTEGPDRPSVAHGPPHRPETRAGAQFRFRRRPSSASSRGRSLRPRRQAGACGRHGSAHTGAETRGPETAPPQPAGHGLPAAPRPTQPAAPKPAGAPLPISSEDRAAEIMKVQRDIARRRRKRLILLATRLTFFVLLPTLLVSFYFYRVATPMYATHSEFIIQKAESSGGGAGGGLGGLLGGSGFATVQESITVQAYLESREAMLRLDEELGFRDHFSQAEIDPLTRIADGATVEDMYDVYLRNLRIGYDPTEGLVRMEVIAADPQVSAGFSEALIRYAEERVDQMSQRLREDQMAGASDSFEDAENRVLEAQERVLDLQEQRGVLSTEAEVTTVFGQIQNFELQLQEERLRLDELLSVARPNATRVDVAERNIARLETLIDDLRSGLTDTGTGQVSLARVQSELIIAQADLETRQMMLAQALQQMELARIEANRQSLYLSVGVFPIAPDAPAYPRAFENTLLAFLIFSGIYLLISMTVSILREQVSS